MFLANRFAYLFLVKRVKCSAIFYTLPKTTQPRPQVFLVNGSIIWQFAARFTSFFTYRKILLGILANQKRRNILNEIYDKTGPDYFLI